MDGINFHSNSISKEQVDLSIDFFNNNIYKADNKSRNVENEPALVEERQHAPREWQPQLDSMLDKVAEEEHDSVKLSEINQLLQNNGIQLSQEADKDLETFQGKMAQAMTELLALKKSALLAEKLIQELNGNTGTVYLTKVDNAIKAQQNLANKLRELGTEHPEIEEQFEKLAAKCERLAKGISDTLNSIVPNPRAKAILQMVSRGPELLENLEAELNSCQIGDELKKDVMKKYETVNNALSMFRTPQYLLLLANDILSRQKEYMKGHDADRMYGASVIEEICDNLTSLSDALHDIRKEGHASQAMEAMADAIDHYMVRVINLSNELPDMLEMNPDETFQDLRPSATREQWKPRLDAILTQLSSENYDNVSLEELNQKQEDQFFRDPFLNEALNLPSVNLDENDQNELSALKNEMSKAMEAIHDLKGVEIRKAYAQESATNKTNENQKVLDIVDNAILAQQNLSDKLRELEKKYPALQDRMEELADKCDRRASEIMAAVNEIINPPRAEEILQEFGKSPVSLKMFNATLDNCGVNDTRKALVRRKYNEAMEALSNLSSQNALTLIDELQHGNANGQPTHFTLVYDTLIALSEALHNLRGQNRGGEAFENMAKAVDHQMVLIFNLGKQLPDLLQAHDNETVKELMIAVIPQMHGTQDILAHFNNELAPLMQKIDDFTTSPETVHDYGEIVMMSKKLTELKQGMNLLLQEGQLQRPDSSRFILDTSVLTPLQKLLEKAQKSLEKFVNFFQKNAKTHQLKTAINKNVPIDVPGQLLKSAFWKSHFPVLNRLAEISVGIHQLGKLAQSNSQQAVDGLKKYRGELEDLRKKDNFGSCYTQEINNLGQLQKSIRKIIHQEDIPDEELDGLVQELREHADSEKGTGDVISGLEIEKFNVFKELVEASLDDFDYKMRYLENIFSNAQAQNQLCDEYMKGAMLLKALKENIPLSTLIETRLHNMPVEYIDPLCDDSNLVEPPKYLSHGNANTVQKCSFKNKEGLIVDKVFKPEYEGRLGNLMLVLNLNGVPTLQNAYLNVASQKMAEKLKSGEIMPKTSVGMLQGEYGLFMDYVEGSTPAHISSEYYDIINSLSGEQKTEVRGTLMKKTNKLQWNDLLMAQGDRHENNYAFNLKQINGKCETKLVAYDNDACLVDWRPGLTKVNIRGEHLNILHQMTYRYNGGEDKFILDVEKDGGLIREQDGSFTFDTSKMNVLQLEVLHLTTGIQNFKVPEYMDQDIYDGLMELKEHPEDFEASLPPDLTPAARNAARARLHEMIDLAMQYKTNGKVLDTNQWNDPKVQQDVKNKNLETLIKAGGGFGSQDRRLTDLFFRDFDWRLS